MDVLHLSIGVLLLAATYTEGRRTGLRDRPSVETEQGCGVCDIRSCPTLQAGSCPGLVVKDQCDCCPVCTASFINGTQFDANNGSGCANVKCPRMQLCVLNIQGLPLCRCPSVYHCRQLSRRPICGRDGNTYKNRCYLQMAECTQSHKIRVAHSGTCSKTEKMKAARSTEIPPVAQSKQINERKLNKERKKNRRRQKLEKMKKKYFTSDLKTRSEDLPRADVATAVEDLTSKEMRRQRRKEKKRQRRRRRRLNKQQKKKLRRRRQD